MTTRKCPKCYTEFELPPLSFPFMLPPTDNDYEWVDSSATLSCPHCNANLIVWARQYIYEDKQEIGELKFLSDGKEGHFSYQLSVISYQLSVPLAEARGLKYGIIFFYPLKRGGFRPRFFGKKKKKKKKKKK